MSTDNEQPAENGESFRNNEEIMHQDESNSSFESPATNNEMQHQSNLEMNEMVDIIMNEVNENEEIFGVMQQEIIDNSFESQQNIPNESNNSNYPHSSSEMTPVSRFSTEISSSSSEHALIHSDASQTSQNPQHEQNEHKLITIRAANGKIEQLGTNIIITINGQADEQRLFTFHSNIGH